MNLPMEKRVDDPISNPHSYKDRQKQKNQHGGPGRAARLLFFAPHQEPAVSARSASRMGMPSSTGYLRPHCVQRIWLSAEDKAPRQTGQASIVNIPEESPWSVMSTVYASFTMNKDDDPTLT
jgi:hypothetical protein